MEVAHVSGFGFQLSGCLVGVDGWGWGEPVLAVLVAGDVPAVVVEEEVVVFAEEDAVGDVGLAVVGDVFVDVVGFAPGHGGVASFGGAASPFDGEGDALGFGEQALLSSDIQGVEGVSSGAKGNQ